MEELIGFLNSLYPLSEGLQQYLFENLQYALIEKKKYLLRKGRVCHNIYFIHSGLVRCFYIRHDREVSSWFMKEGDVITSVDSFFNQSVSEESIQALEDTVVYSLSHDELQHIYTSFPEFNFAARLLTEKYYKLSEQRLYSLRMQRAPEKYAFLMQHFPQLIQRVPSKYLASYLSITEETLSRIRAMKY